MNEVRLTRWFVRTLLFLAALFLLYYGGLTWLANSKEKQLNQGWGAIHLEPATLSAMFPPTEMNETARVLKKAVEPDRNPFELSGFNRVPPFSEGWRVLEDPLDEPTDEIALPQGVKLYLASHRADLTKLYDQVRREPPQSQQDTSLLDSPFPDLIEQRALINLIALDALGKAEAGNDPEALQTFSAAWIINSSLARRPEEVSQSAAIGQAGILSRTLRKMRRVPPEWQRRLLEHDYRTSSQFSEALAASQMVERVKHADNLFPRGNTLISGNLLTRLGRPYFRMCVLDGSDAIRKRIEALQSDRCSIGPDRGRVVESLAWWNGYAARHIAGSLTAGAAAHVMLHIEATEKILRVKAAAVNGTLPETVPGLQSAVCDDAGWEYSRGPSGRFTLKYSKPLDWVKDRRFRDNPAEITWQFTRK